MIYELAALLPQITANAAKLNIPLINREIEVWVQTWADTSCGFGGLAGQALTHAYTVILHYGNSFDIFINGQHAYSITKPSEEFKKDYTRRRLRGQGEGWTHYQAKE